MYDDIGRVVDKYFDFIEELDGFHDDPGFIPEDMKDNARLPSFEGSQCWKTIPSTVTDSQILEYEKQLGLRLPDSYRFFLKYKNFIELSLGEFPVMFFSNLSTNWLEALLEQSKCYRERLRGKGLIPFGYYSDCGVLCFDTNATSGNGSEYSVVWLDREDDFEKKNLLARDFTQLIARCEPHLDEWIKSSRESRQESARHSLVGSHPASSRVLAPVWLQPLSLCLRQLG